MSVKIGTIIWAALRPRGGNKERPAVVVTEADEDGLFWVVGATSQFSRPLRPIEVELPCRYYGHPLTKLRKPTVAVCNWVEEIGQRDVLDVGGYLPEEVLAEVLEKSDKYLP